MPREAVKERMVAIVRRAGPAGISCRDLYDIIYQHHEARPHHRVIKSHAWQLRKKGVPIRGQRGGNRLDGVYTLDRRK